MSTVAVSYTTEELQTKAINLAAQLNLPVFALDNISPAAKLLLVQTATHLEIRDLTGNIVKPFYINFCSEKLRHRQQSQKLKQEMLLKATGKKSGDGLVVIDATAGFGRDSLLFASFGCEVIMLERSPIIAALLEDGLARLKEHHPNLATLLQLHLVAADTYLNNLSLKNKPDIIYLDPMYPKRTKTALVKKEARFLQQLVGKDEDAGELLKIAITIAKKRVIVKRPRLAATLDEQSPDIIYAGKSTRFDVYLVNNNIRDLSP